MPKQSESSNAIGETSAKYFLDKRGIETRRMTNLPGQSHFDIARRVLPGEGGALYQRMFALGYVRVTETAGAILVDAPKGLSRRQTMHLDGKSKATAKPLQVNDAAFLKTRDPRGE